MLWLRKLLNYLKENIWDYYFNQKNGLTNIYIVTKNDTKIYFSIEKLLEPYKYIEFEFIYENKVFTHILKRFENINKDIIFLSVILNDTIDITDYFNQYTNNDLSILKIKNIIPQIYISIFEKLEIIDNDCNSFIYRNINDIIHHQNI
jgi:hypothetical protein